MAKLKHGLQLVGQEDVFRRAFCTHIPTCVTSTLPPCNFPVLGVAWPPFILCVWMADLHSFTGIMKFLFKRAIEKLPETFFPYLVQYVLCREYSSEHNMINNCARGIIFFSHIYVCTDKVCLLAASRLNFCSMFLSSCHLSGYLCLFYICFSSTP